MLDAGTLALILLYVVIGFVAAVILFFPLLGILLWCLMAAYMVLYVIFWIPLSGVLRFIYWLKYRNRSFGRRAKQVEARRPHRMSVPSQVRTLPTPSSENWHRQRLGAQPLEAAVRRQIVKQQRETVRRREQQGYYHGWDRDDEYHDYPDDADWDDHDVDWGETR